MPKSFMIFYREVDHQHYLYNGEWPIAINPFYKVPFGLFSPEDTTDQQIANTESSLNHLNEVLLNTRKKVFTINKHRYMIIYRGTFIED